MLQETMGMEEEISLHLKKYFTSYDFHAINACGRSRGLALGWNPRTVKLLETWGFESGIGVVFFHVGQNISFTIVNIYRPYNDRVAYWNRIKLKPFLINKNVILGGDLNFTLGNFEN